MLNNIKTLFDVRQMTQENLQQQDISSKQEALKQAFLQFNQVSFTLSEAYAGLESKVETLTNELTEARSQKLKELEAKEKVTNRLQNLLSALPAAIIVLDGEGVIQQTNPAAEELFESALLEQSWRDVVANAFQPQWDDGHDVTLKNGRCVNISTQPLGSEPGQILLITDVTETRQLQEQIAGFKRVSAMGEMAAAMAHQIRTPLASAMLYVSLQKKYWVLYNIWNHSSKICCYFLVADISTLHRWILNHCWRSLFSSFNQKTYQLKLKMN